MRKHIILATMATAALFTACSNETEEAAKQSMEVRFCVTNNNLTTRATTTESNGTYTTTFGENDEITIYSSNLKEDMNGVTGKVNGSNVTINGDATYYYKDLTTTATFNAFYPADATYSNGAVSFIVATDQSTNFDANEFMVATATGKGSEVNPVALSFEHQLALVVLNLSGLDDATEVTMNSVKSTVSYVFGTNTLTTEEEASDITMNKRGDTQTYWAMVPAQTFVNGSKLFTITTATATYTYTVTAEAGLTTAKNTIHTITLSKKLNETQLSASISGWNTIDPWTGGDVSKEPIVLIDNESFDNVNLTGTTVNTNITAGNWGYAFNSTTSNTTLPTGTVEITNDSESDANKVLHINLTAYNSWHNSTVYRVISGATRSKYRLSFSAKASESCSLLIFINGTKVNNESNALMKIESGEMAYSQITKTIGTNWDTYTVDFDFSYKSVSGTTSSQTFASETVADNLATIYLGFVPTSTNTNKDFYIDNVNLKEVVE